MKTKEEFIKQAKSIQKATNESKIKKAVKLIFITQKCIGHDASIEEFCHFQELLKDKIFRKELINIFFNPNHING